jgi:hypothetical protein
MIDIVAPKKLYDFTLGCCIHLNIHNLSSKEVVVVMKKRLPEEAFGYTYGDRRHAEIHVAKTQDGEPLDERLILSTLAHELVHAKQYFRGELTGLYEEFGLWKGKAHPYHDYNSPWEKEAYRLEKEMMELYERHNLQGT